MLWIIFVSLWLLGLVFPYTLLTIAKYSDRKIPSPEGSERRIAPGSCPWLAAWEQREALKGRHMYPWNSVPVISDPH